MWRDYYVYFFIRCKKCNKKINLRKQGAYHYKHNPPIIGGWYHHKCGMTNSENVKQGLVPF